MKHWLVGVAALAMGCGQVVVGTAEDAAVLDVADAAFGGRCPARYLPTDGGAAVIGYPRSAFLVESRSAVGPFRLDTELVWQRLRRIDEGAPLGCTPATPPDECRARTRLSFGMKSSTPELVIATTMPWSAHPTLLTAGELVRVEAEEDARGQRLVVSRPFDGSLVYAVYARSVFPTEAFGPVRVERGRLVCAGALVSGCREAIGAYSLVFVGDRGARVELAPGSQGEVATSVGPFRVVHAVSTRAEACRVEEVVSFEVIATDTALAGP